MMRRHAELLSEHMGEERGCKEFRKHVSWYLKGFAAGGTLRHSLALVDSLAALDALLDELDPDEPFPVSELGAPRGRQGSPRRKVALPEGWLDDTDGTDVHRPRGRVRGHGRITVGSRCDHGRGDREHPRKPGPELGAGRAGCASLGTSRRRRSTGLTVHVPRHQQQRISAVADHRHKRDTNARRFRPSAQGTFVAGPIALVATLSTVGAGVLAASPETRDLLATSSATTGTSPSAAVDLSDRTPVVSRSGTRIEPPRARSSRCSPPSRHRQGRPAGRHQALDHRRPQPLDHARETRQQARRGRAGKKVLVTGREAAGRAEIVVDGKSRWVTAGYLSDDKPRRRARRGVGGACTNGSSVSRPAQHARGPPGRLRRVPRDHRRTAPTGRDGEHAQGIAIDIMVSGDRGWQVAEFVRAHYAELGVSYVIYSQRIWSVDRAGEGWRYM